MKYDVIVVGAGPSGAIAAKTCAERGLKTLLLEKKEFNREKPCGGGLTNKVLKRFAIPEDVVERYYDGMTLCLEDESVKFNGKERLGALVCRGKFDSTLVRMAEDAGAEIREKIRVFDLIRKNNFVIGVIARGNEKVEEISANLVIGADGQSSIVRRKLGAFQQNWGRISLWFLYHMELSNELIDEQMGNRLEMYFGKEISRTAYAWIFPKNGIVTVGIGALMSEIREDKVQLRERLNNFVKKHPIASEKLAMAKIIMNQGGRITSMGTSSSTYFNGTMLVGEAAGHAMLSSGEGIYYAMVGGQISGEWAANAISAGDLSKKFLSGYENAWRAEIGGDLERSVVISETLGEFHTPLKHVLKAVEGNPRMRELLMDTLLSRPWGLL